MTHTDDTIPYGFCHCGCGQKTNLATQTRRRFGHVKGEPMRFVVGHVARLRSKAPQHCADCGAEISIRATRCKGCAPRHAASQIEGLPEPPNPSGLCMCGCGQKTKIARQTDRTLGFLRGHPVKYCSGHNRYKDGSDVEYVVSETGCWIWQRAIGTRGYSFVRGKNQGHRAFYERYKGKIPKGLVLHHTCGIRRCVNPDHLIPMSRNDHQRLHRAMTPPSPRRDPNTRGEASAK